MGLAERQLCLKTSYLTIRQTGTPCASGPTRRRLRPKLCASPAWRSSSPRPHPPQLVRPRQITGYSAFSRLFILPCFSRYSLPHRRYPRRLRLRRLPRNPGAYPRRGDRRRQTHARRPPPPPLHGPPSRRPARGSARRPARRLQGVLARIKNENHLVVHLHLLQRSVAVELEGMR